MSNFPIELPFELPTVDAKYLPAAYILLGVGVLLVVKKPSTLLSLLSSYYTIKHLVAEGQAQIK